MKHQSFVIDQQLSQGSVFRCHYRLQTFTQRLMSCKRVWLRLIEAFESAEKNRDRPEF